MKIERCYYNNKQQPCSLAARSTSSRLELIKVLKRRDYYSQHTVDEYFTGFIQIPKDYTAIIEKFEHQG